MKTTTYAQRALLLLLLFVYQNSEAQNSTSWKGIVNNSWDLVSNWTNGLPDLTKDVIIGDSYFTGTNQPRITSVSYCKSLSVGSVSAITLTLARTLMVSENLTIHTNGTIIHSNSTLILRGNWINNGNYITTSTSSKLSLFGGIEQTIGGSSITTFRSLYISTGTTMTMLNDIDLSGTGNLLSVYGELNPGVSPGFTLTSTGSIKVFDGAKLKVNNATFADNYVINPSGFVLYSGSIVDYASTSVDQTISPLYTYSTLMISGSGVKSLTSNLPSLYSRNITNGIIVVNGGTFDMQTYAANRGSYTIGGNISVSDGAELKISGVSNFPRNFSRKTFSTNSLVNYYGTNQDISEQQYGNVLLSGGGTKSALLPFSAAGDLTIEEGILNTSSNSITISIKGDFTMSGGTIAGTNAVYEMNGTDSQSINLLSSLPNLTMTKTGGTLLLGSDLTITNELLFNSGVIQTGSYSVVLNDASSLIGASQSSGWVYGNLKKTIATGSSVTKIFEVGTETIYSPATVVFHDISTAGSFTSTAALNDHPELDYSGIDPVKSVNRYWSFINEGVVFLTADPSFDWNSSDLDAGANSNTFLLGYFDGNAWSKPAVTIQSVTSIGTTGLTTLESFAVGEKITAYQWSGAAYTSEWYTPKNWYGGVPEENSAVTIPNPLSGRRNYPILTSSQIVQIGDLTIENEGYLELEEGILQISGNASSTGTFDASNGTVEFNGSAPQTISSGLFYNNKIKNLTISNNVTLADTDSITGTLTISEGKTFSTNDNLVLKSDANGTANIAPLTVDGSGNATSFIEGNVSIERYIPARKAWRLLSAPVKSSTSSTICGAWQEGSYGTSFAPNPNPHYGVHITGGTILNGFDQSPTNQTSIKYYNNSTNAFTALPSTPGTLTSISSYNGYMIYIRGDRSIDLMQGLNAAVTSTTLRMKGEVKTGSQTVTVNAHNFTVLGNPFPSAINFETLTRSNVKNSFYIWDPKLAGSNGLGAYVTVSFNSGSGTYDVTTSSSSISQYIPSGEAVLIESSDGVSAGSIVVKESDKTSNGTDFLFGRINNAAQSLRANLYAVETNGTYSLLDGAMTTYQDRNTNAIDKDDITKLNGGSEGISFSRNGNNLAIERRRTISGNDTSFISLVQTKMQNYRLDIIAENMNNDNLVAVVLDNYSGLTNNLPVDLKGTTHVDFTINNDIASADPNRFSVVFKKNPTAQPVEVKRSANNINLSDAIKNTTATAVVYPNPVISNEIKFNLNNVGVGNYILTLYNIKGQLIASQTIKYSPNSGTITMKVNNGFTPGKYELKIAGEGKSISTSVLKH